MSPEQYIAHYRRLSMVNEGQAKRVVERIKMLTKEIKLEGKNYRY
jgi:hypothetical protein